MRINNKKSFYTINQIYKAMEENLSLESIKDALQQLDKKARQFGNKKTVNKFEQKAISPIAGKAGRDLISIPNPIKSDNPVIKKVNELLNRQPHLGTKKLDLEDMKPINFAYQSKTKGKKEYQSPKISQVGNIFDLQDAIKKMEGETKAIDYLMSEDIANTYWWLEKGAHFHDFWTSTHNNLIQDLTVNQQRLKELIVNIEKDKMVASKSLEKKYKSPDVRKINEDLSVHQGEFLKASAQKNLNEITKILYELRKSKNTPVEMMNTEKNVKKLSDYLQSKIAWSGLSDSSFYYMDYTRKLAHYKQELFNLSNLLLGELENKRITTEQYNSVKKLIWKRWDETNEQEEINLKKLLEVIDYGKPKTK